MLKHFLLLSQNADSSRNDVTDASGTITDLSQVSGTHDPLQSNNAPVYCTPVGSVATTLFLVFLHSMSKQVCPVMSLWNHSLQNLT